MEIVSEDGRWINSYDDDGKIVGRRRNPDFLLRVQRYVTEENTYVDVDEEVS